MANITIALDAMGGDHGPTVVVPAALFFANRHSDVCLILVGDESVLNDILQSNKYYDQRIAERISVHHASEVVHMDDPPALALRNKKDSSMRVAINLVKEGKANACVSAGNTGALMAVARFVLKMIPGIDRPAICSALPAKQGHTHMMDLGANVDCTSEHLYQFALMGAELVKAIDNIPSPRVALLNIGEEEIKGNDQVKQANQLLNNSELNYVGYVEGNDIYGSSTDVVISDGFVGNVSLKSSEGVATMFAEFLKEEFMRNIFTKIIGLIALPVLKAFKRRADPRRYNGASLLGLQGIVIKSHGSADRVAFANAIKIATLEVKKDVISQIGAQINLQND